MIAKTNIPFCGMIHLGFVCNKTVLINRFFNKLNLLNEICVVKIKKVIFEF